MRKKVRMLIWQDVRNLGISINRLLLWTFLATDSRMTISAWTYLHGPIWLQRLIDWIYLTVAKDKDHVKKAARGWEDAQDMSIPWKVAVPFRILLVCVLLVVVRTCQAG